MIDDTLSKRHPGDIYAPQAKFKDFDEDDLLAFLESQVDAGVITEEEMKEAQDALD